MRAGRLLSLMLILQRRGRVTAADLAVELEVSVRTVLRDIEELSGAGVPIYATRGPGGGFQLMEGRIPELGALAEWVPARRAASMTRRAAVRISPEGRRRAALLGRLQPLRVRRAVAPDDLGWVEATFRLASFEGAIADVLSLGPHIEVIDPMRLRTAVALRSKETAHLYEGPPGADAGRR